MSDSCVACRYFICVGEERTTKNRGSSRRLDTVMCRTEGAIGDAMLREYDLAMVVDGAWHHFVGQFL